MTATYEVVYGEVTRRTDRREHYHERWQRAVERELTFGLYVPAPGTVTCIMPGSAIIGSPSGDRLQLHFEGGKFQPMEWKDKVGIAASRHITVYPTIAQVLVDPQDWIRVGTYHCLAAAPGWPAHAVLAITDEDALTAWRTS